MAVNTIKLVQLATGEIAAFINSGLGIVSGTNIQHTTNEEFLSNLGIGGNLNVTGNLNAIGPATFQSGFISNTGIQIQGEISGRSLKIDNFSIPSGILNAANVGTLTLTGIPIYDSGLLSSGLALSSGTVFGLKQKLNEPRFEYDSSGNLQPFTGVGLTAVILCMSTGT